MFADVCYVWAGEWWWSPLLEELQEEGKCVQADSWSLAVEQNFLQTLHKDLIKQQDVVYGKKFRHVEIYRLAVAVWSEWFVWLVYHHDNSIFLSVSQSSSRRSSTMCGLWESWRGCTGGGCKRKWYWSPVWFIPSSPVWTSCWSSTPASCLSFWTGGSRDWWRVAQPTSSSEALGSCCSDRYGGLLEDSLRDLGFLCFFEV